MERLIVEGIMHCSGSLPWLSEAWTRRIGTGEAVNSILSVSGTGSMFAVVSWIQSRVAASAKGLPVVQR